MTCATLSLASAAIVAISFFITPATARPMHAGIDYQRYLEEKDAIAEELSAWMDKYKEDADRNGWIPPTESRSPEEVAEDRQQRFFMSKQLVASMKEKNPDAEFSTDSPFTLMTTQEFAKYVNNSYLKGETRRLRAQQQSDNGGWSFSDIIDGGQDGWQQPAPGPVSPAFPNGPTPGPTAGPEPTAPVRAPGSEPTQVTAPGPGPGPGPGPVTGPGPGAGPSSSFTVDWSSTPCMAPVQKQGGCGSCWAFASVAAVESALCIRQGGYSFVKLSEQNVASCSTNTSGCKGGSSIFTYEYIQRQGICRAQDDPYTSGNGRLAACNKSCTRVRVPLKSIKYLKGEEQLLSAIKEYPVLVHVAAGNKAWKQYKSGVVSSCGDGQLNHGVVAVGYDASSIKIRNSWGAKWGDNGYIRLRRSGGESGTCGLLKKMDHLVF